MDPRTNAFTTYMGLPYHFGCIPAKPKTQPARTGPETPTIRCECCEGIGLVEEPGSWGDYGSRIPEVVECPLCHGTGFEPADVQPRKGTK